MLPHLVLNPADREAVVACEQKGPVFLVMKFADIDEAVRGATRAPTAWPARCGRETSSRPLAIGSRLEAGTTWVNSHNLASSDVDCPFGGYQGKRHRPRLRRRNGPVAIHAVQDDLGQLPLTARSMRSPTSVPGGHSASRHHGH